MNTKYRFHGEDYETLSSLLTFALVKIYPDTTGCFTEQGFLIVTLPGDPVPEKPGTPFGACKLVRYGLTEIRKHLIQVSDNPTPDPYSHASRSGL